MKRTPTLNNGDLPSTTEDGIFFAASPDREMQLVRNVKSLRLLWDRRRFLCRLVIWGTLSSAAITLIIPTRYEATTQLMPPDSQSGTGTALLSAITGRAMGTPNLAAIAGDALGMRNSGALFVGIIGSRTVQDRLIETFDLRRVYGASKVEDARIRLKQHTRTEEDRKSGIITITVTDTNPKRAADLAQAYVSELDRLVAAVSTSAARRERIFLEERLHSVKQDLDDAAHKFSEFASKNTAIDIPAQGKTMVEAAAVLGGQLIAAESELKGLETVYADQNVRVRALRARVSELREQLNRMGGDSAVQPKGTDGNELALYPSIRQLPALGVTWADLYRQTKIQETVYEVLTQQYELAKVQEAKEIPSVKVLDRAIVPTKKSFPPRALLTLTATVLVFLGACGWILVHARWRELDSADPMKQFVREVAGTLRADVEQVLVQAPVVRRTLTRFSRWRDRRARPKESELAVGSEPRDGRSTV